MKRNYIASIAVILLLTSAASSQRLTGVWRLSEVRTTGAGAETIKFTQPNMYLFTKGHYSIIRVEGDKPRSTDDARKMTAEQLVDTYVSSFTANAGTYVVNGGKLTMKVMVAKSPTFMLPGHWVSFNVKVTGQQMTLTSTANNDGPIKDPTTLKLTRVE